MSITQFDEVIIYNILEFSDTCWAITFFPCLLSPLTNIENDTLANVLRLVCRKYFYMIRSMPFHKFTLDLVMKDANGSPYIPRLLYYGHKIKIPSSLYIGETLCARRIPPSGTIKYADLNDIDNTENLQYQMSDIRTLRISPSNMEELYNNEVIMPKCTYIRCYGFEKEWFKCVPNVKEVMGSILIADIIPQLKKIEVDYPEDDDDNYCWPNIEWVDFMLDDDLAIIGVKSELTERFSKIFPNAIVYFDDGH